MGRTAAGRLAGGAASRGRRRGRGRGAGARGGRDTGRGALMVPCGGERGVQGRTRDIAAGRSRGAHAPLRVGNRLRGGYRSFVHPFGRPTAAGLAGAAAAGALAGRASAHRVAEVPASLRAPGAAGRSASAGAEGCRRGVAGTPGSGATPRLGSDSGADRQRGSGLRHEHAGGLRGSADGFRAGRMG